MAENKVALEVTVGGTGEVAQELSGINTSVKSFREQLREANNELNTAVQKFGLTSKEAANAAKAVANLKDTMGDAKNLADAFNPDKKFQALTQVVGGAAAGFTAFQGALALTGSKSEDLEKTLVKVQGAMAFSQGINQLLEMKDTFSIVGNVIRTNVISAFTTLRGAIIATGVGALAVGLGLLIANFDKVKQAILNMFPGLATLAKWFGKMIDQVTDFVGVTSQAERALDSLMASQKENLEKQEKWLDQNADKYDQYTNRKFQAEVEYQKKIAEITQRQKDQKRKENDEDLKDIQAYKDKFNRTIDKIDADRANANKNKDVKTAKKKDDIHPALRDAGYLDPESLGALDAQRDELYNKGLEHATKMSQVVIDNAQVRTASEKANADARMSIDQIETEAKQRNVAVAMDLANAVADLVGRNTATGKAIAVAMTTIQTYQAAQAAYSSQLLPGDPSSPIRAAIAAGTAIVGGLARVKQILAVNVPGGKGGGVPSLGSSASTPVKPTFTEAKTVKIDQQQVNQLGDQSNIRAYIIQSDITNADSRNQRIERASVLGG